MLLQPRSGCVFYLGKDKPTGVSKLFNRYLKIKMNKLFLTLAGLYFFSLSFGQTSNQKLIEVAKSYKNFMFRNDLTRDDLKELKSNVPENFKPANDFIIETLTKKNKLLTNDFLTRPSDETLKQIYIIRVVNLNLREEIQVDNNRLIDSLTTREIPVYELVDNYYEMMFASVGNKNQPFDLSDVDIKLNDYNLKDETEKGILFLQCMRFCGVTIWGYMNIPKPPNTKKAYENIKLFPKFNGRPYFQYTDLHFPDFKMKIVKDQGVQSYKGYYIDKYYETLLSHLICLNKEGGSEKEKNDLLLGSILEERNLYQYTKYRETLESIFKEQKQ
jgi:hypothetical protein